MRCSDLKSITIPNSVTSIGNYAFYGCKNLMDVFCFVEEVDSLKGYMFDDNIKKSTLHVPLNVIESYRTQEPWCNFMEIVALTEEETVICGTPARRKRITDIFSLDGNKTNKMLKGVHIIRYDDGTTKKILTK